MNQRTAQRSRRIVSEPIRPLLIRLTGSALIGNVAMHTLGVVDTFFISRLGTIELAAASFVIPIHMIYISLALGIGMGISSLNSRLVGENRFADSARLISDGLIFAGLFAVVMALLGASMITPLFRLLGAEADTLPIIHDYLSILLLGLPPLMMVTIGNSTFRSVGNIRMSALLAASMSLLNLALDPLLIFGVGPFPALGIQGAAWATLIAAVITMGISFHVLSVRESMLDLGRPLWTVMQANWRRILNIAIPAMGANMMTPLAAAIMTAMVSGYGDSMVAGFGVGSRIEMFSLMVVMGLSATLPMFIGQNIGAGRDDRAYRALTGCLKFVLGLQIIIYLLLLVFARQVAGWFSAETEVVDIIVIFLRILPLTYGAHGVVVLVMVSLNVLGHPRLALLLTVMRLMVLYLPLAWLGSQVWGITGLFIGAACGNILAGLFAFGLISRVCRRLGLADAGSEAS